MLGINTERGNYSTRIRESLGSTYVSILSSSEFGYGKDSCGYSRR